MGEWKVKKKMKRIKRNICQSCGMSMKRMSDFGSNQDGSINTDYCYHCYADGIFVDKNISLEEKIAKNIALAQKFGMSRIKASKLANSVLPQLKRWHKKKTLKAKNK